MTDLALTRRTATLGLTAAAFTGLARSGWATARDPGACEDQYTETVANRLIGVTPAGQTYVLGFLRAQTELTGACFSPDGRTLYVNCYSPARTLAITMPTRAGA